ncbi:hypothetical protein K7432_006558, partial [Basidiobolus ranarum]
STLTNCGLWFLNKPVSSMLITRKSFLLLTLFVPVTVRFLVRVVFPSNLLSSRLVMFLVVLKRRLSKLVVLLSLLL